MIRAIKTLCAAGVIAVSYFIGEFSGTHHVWPLSHLSLFRGPPPVPWMNPPGRLVSYPGKQEVACPAQTPRTRVILAIGQSNAANQGGQRYASTHGINVISFFRGKCYIAASPLLGTSGSMGESWTLLGNDLISAGAADRVILITDAIGGSYLKQWEPGADFHRMLLSDIASILPKYQITAILWHQGESDFYSGTSELDYEAMFRSLVASLRHAGVTAPIFISVASKCGIEPAWRPDNPVTRAQRALPDPKLGIYAGVDTDALMVPLDRYDDCHFDASGQEKFAAAWVKVLRAHAGGKLLTAPGSGDCRPAHGDAFGRSPRTCTGPS
jgi:hypothetical protein